MIVVVTDLRLMQWQKICADAGLLNLAADMREQRAGRTNWADLARAAKVRARSERNTKKRPHRSDGGGAS